MKGGPRWPLFSLEFQPGTSIPRPARTSLCERKRWDESLPLSQSQCLHVRCEKAPNSGLRSWKP